VQEYIPLGQRVKKFSIEAWVENAWTPIDTQTTIGYKRILRFENVTSQKLRFNVLNAKALPADFKYRGLPCAKTAPTTYYPQGQKRTCNADTIR
jgi:hypothetical protein